MSFRILVAGLGSRLVRPAPRSNIGHILAVLPHVCGVFEQLVAKLLLHVCIGHRKARDAVDDVDREMVSVEPVTTMSKGVVVVPSSWNP